MAKEKISPKFIDDGKNITIKGPDGKIIVEPKKKPKDEKKKDNKDPKSKKAKTAAIRLAASLPVESPLRSEILEIIKTSGDE